MTVFSIDKMAPTSDNMNKRLYQHQMLSGVGNHNELTLRSKVVKFSDSHNISLI